LEKVKKRRLKLSKKHFGKADDQYFKKQFARAGKRKNVSALRN
jgi:hypothetical protein